MEGPGSGRCWAGRGGKGRRRGHVGVKGQGLGAAAPSSPLHHGGGRPARHRLLPKREVTGFVPCPAVQDRAEGRRQSC